MPKLEVAPVEFHELRELAETMRDCDRMEVLRSSGLSPEASLARALQLSDWVKTARINGRLVCIYGLSGVDRARGVGSPWMLGTDLVGNYPRIALTAGREIVDEMLTEYPVLTNFVDVENKTSIRWLKRLGFTIGRVEYLGPGNSPFHQFEKRRYV